MMVRGASEVALPLREPSRDALRLGWEEGRERRPTAIRQWLSRVRGVVILTVRLWYDLGANARMHLSMMCLMSFECLSWMRCCDTACCGQGKPDALRRMA